VRDDERDVPRTVCNEPLEGGDDAVEQRADRLAAEELRVFGNHVLEEPDEGLLKLVLGQVTESAALELA
jgi:hypothetical protein